MSTAIKIHIYGKHQLWLGTLSLKQMHITNYSAYETLITAMECAS